MKAITLLIFLFYSDQCYFYQKFHVVVARVREKNKREMNRKRTSQNLMAASTRKQMNSEWMKAN